MTGPETPDQGRSLSHESDADLRALVEALGAPGSASELDAEQRYRRLFAEAGSAPLSAVPAAAHADEPAKVHVLRRRLPGRLAARVGVGSTAAAVVLGTAGVAAAYTASLPAPLQTFAHQVIGAPPKPAPSAEAGGRSDTAAPGGPSDGVPVPVTAPPSDGAPDTSTNSGDGSTPADGSQPPTDSTSGAAVGPTAPQTDPGSSDVVPGQTGTTDPTSTPTTPASTPPTTGTTTPPIPSTGPTAPTTGAPTAPSTPPTTGTPGQPSPTTGATTVPVPGTSPSPTGSPTDTPSEGAVTPQAITLTGDSHRALPGDTRTFTGSVLTPGSPALVGLPVRLMQHDADGWHRAARTLTDDAGAVSFTTSALSATSRFKLVAAGVRSPSWRVVLHPVVTATVTNARPQASFAGGGSPQGGQTTITAWVQGGQIGDVVQLIRLGHGQRVPVATAELGSDVAYNSGPGVGLPAGFDVPAVTHTTRYAVLLTRTSEHGIGRYQVMVTSP